jgi:D-3-phosphoglycerate dehydrogenase
MPRTVVVTDHDFTDLAVERSVLDGIADLVVLADSPGEAVPPDGLTDASAVLNLRSDIDADHLATADKCQIVARYGIGVDNVAVEAATEQGIPVTNVPDYCIEEVATHAVTLLLALSRGLPQYATSIAAGDWNRAAGAPLRRLSTRTVGVVGYGAIGRRVGQRFDALGADIVASDPFLEPSDTVDDPATLVEFNEVLEQADAVTVHSPLTEATRGLFGTEQFDRMRDDAVLVNVARGPIVDGDALVAALDAGDIRGAGLDVMPTEPPAAAHPLRDHDRAIITPHVAWYSEEADEERRRRAAKEVRRALTGEPLENVQNEVGTEG